MDGAGKHAVVLAGPATGRSPSPSAARRPRWEATDRRIVTSLVVLTVLSARLGVPVGPIGTAVALPLTYVLVGVLVLRRRVVPDPLRVELLWIALSASLVATAAVTLQGGSFSAPSLLLLVAIYLPWVLRVAGDEGREVVEHAGRVFVQVMVFVAAMGTAQFAAQLAGVWQYEDYLAIALPEGLLISGYNTSIPLTFGSSLYKANGFVMLEPSFLSQYCALAVVVGLVLGARAWQVLVLLAGLVSAVSGTGLVLLGVGLLLIVVRVPQQIRTGHVLAAATAALLLFLSPAATLLLDRRGEVSQAGSSGNARFLQPFVEVLRGLEAVPGRYLTGAGAGNSDRLLASARDGIGFDVLYSTVPKLVFEYGLIAGGLFLLFMVLSMFDRAPWPVVPGMLVVMTFLLSGGLLQAQTAYLAWLLTGFGAVTRPGMSWAWAWTSARSHAPPSAREDAGDHTGTGSPSSR